MGAGQGHPQVPLGLCHSPMSSTPCRSQGDAGSDGVFLGKENLAAFFSWLDYLDELVMGAQPVRSTRPAPQSRGSSWHMPWLSLRCHPPGRGRCHR